MARFLLTVEAQDRPGIVASATKALAAAGCNLADVSMTRLSGVFVLLAVVTAPDDIDTQSLWSASSFEGDATWRPISEAQANPDVFEGARWSITVYGSDQLGIVAAVTAELSRQGVNIDDLSTRLVGSDDAAIYTMMIDATVPSSVNDVELQVALATIGKTLGFTCHANPVDVDTL